MAQTSAIPPLHLLADENIAREIVERLRAEGLQVEWVRDVARGAKDPPVLALAVAHHLIILTNALDFGALIYRDRLPAPAEGVVQSRVARLPLDQQIEIVAAFFRRFSATDIAGQFVTIDGDGIYRFRPL